MLCFTANMIFVSFSNLRVFQSHLEAISYGLKLITTVSSPNISDFFCENELNVGENAFGYFLDNSYVREISQNEVYDMFSKVSSSVPVELSRRTQLLDMFGKSNC